MWDVGSDPPELSFKECSVLLRARLVHVQLGGSQGFVKTLWSHFARPLALHGLPSTF